MRDLVRETRLAQEDLVYPLFVVPGEKQRRAVVSMPGVFQLSVDELVAECQAASEAGVRAVLLFGIPSGKDSVGSEAYADDGIITRARRAVRAAVPELVLISDVCLCEYTDHGHCGVLVPGRAGATELVVDNDATLELLAR
jgi:porphobilinogen synthase